jgi:hypothetical protein
MTKPHASTCCGKPSSRKKWELPWRAQRIELRWLPWLPVNGTAALFSLLSRECRFLAVCGQGRFGWIFPIPTNQFPIVHGPLMVIGFLGTLIGLERAVALGQVWPYGIPVLSGVSALSALAALPAHVSAAPAIAASLLLIAVFATLYRQYPSEHFVIMGLSAFAWLAGNIIWFESLPFFHAIPWWTGFLVLMIAGERLELSRVRRPSVTIRAIFHASVAILLIGLVLSIFEFHSGVRLAGLGLFAIASWLLRYDLAWHSARQAGLPRYMAACLIAGYIWLAAGGIMWLLFAQFFSAGPRYDAMLHTIFVGFVFSMIFAHAPIILPTITGMALPFRNSFYLHAGLLHVSLLLRIAGDLGLWLLLQQWGGLLNTLTVFLFLINNIRAVKVGAAATLKAD